MDIKMSIKEFVFEEMTENGFKGDIGNGDSLIDLDILDSLSMLKLLSFFDEKFNIFLSEDELDPDNFETINLISQFIQMKLDQK